MLYCGIFALSVRLAGGYIVENVYHTVGSRLQCPFCVIKVFI
ncbi:hypothetical protein SP19_62 [Salmonella phage 19]|nr:hypothetical protein SP19_62 [Salmonella phage 19]